MPYTVTLRRSADGVERDHHNPDEWVTNPDDPDDNPWFWWIEGNGGCDCNRALFFARAGDEPEPEDPPCGDTRYTLVRVTLEDGRVLMPPTEHA